MEIILQSFFSHQVIVCMLHFFFSAKMNLYTNIVLVQILPSISCPQKYIIGLTLSQLWRLNFFLVFGSYILHASHHFYSLFTNYSLCNFTNGKDTTRRHCTTQPTKPSQTKFLCTIYALRWRAVQLEFQISKTNIPINSMNFSAIYYQSIAYYVYNPLTKYGTKVHRIDGEIDLWNLKF